MKALVIWESVTGTTKKAAGLIAGGLRAGGIEASVCPATRVDHGALSAASLVVVGSWTDGLVFIGQKPGRQSRLWSLPFMTGKQAFVYCTYAVDAGHAVDKLAAIVSPSHRNCSRLLTRSFSDRMLFLEGLRNKLEYRKGR